MANETDLTIHVDDVLSDDQRSKLMTLLENQTGVANVIYHEKRPHLIIVNYHSEETSSQSIITLIRNQNVQAEIIGV